MTETETVLRVMGAALLMPLSLRAPRTRPALAVYSVGLPIAIIWGSYCPHAS